MGELLPLPPLLLPAGAAATIAVVAAPSVSETTRDDVPASKIACRNTGCAASVGGLRRGTVNEQGSYGRIAPRQQQHHVLHRLLLALQLFSRDFFLGTHAKDLARGDGRQDAHVREVVHRRQRPQLGLGRLSHLQANANRPMDQTPLNDQPVC